MKAKKKSNLPLKEAIKVATQHGREFDKRYISRVPRKPLSVGYVLVHNQIAHTKDMPVGSTVSASGHKRPSPRRWSFANVDGKAWCTITSKEGAIRASPGPRLRSA